MKSNASILFLGKKDDAHCARALNFCINNFADVTECLGAWGEPLPERARNWTGEYIISYLSRWVVPAALINRATCAAINFHPATPDYPGIGCNNFALYDNASEYGATCHHMAPQVDTGNIIAVTRFPVFPTDTVGSILERTYDHQITLFYEIMGQILQAKPLPVSEETWTRKPFSRNEFNTLCTITPDMDEAELKRRIRATSFGPWQPYIILHGRKFMLTPE